jgi:hypothetical protein
VRYEDDAKIGYVVAIKRNNRHSSDMADTNPKFDPQTGEELVPGIL